MKPSSFSAPVPLLRLFSEILSKADSRNKKGRRKRE
jgi:hypothetical protein